MAAVAHLARDRDGWVFLLSSNSLLLILQVLLALPCSGMGPPQVTVALRRGHIKSPLLSCGQQDLGSDNPHGDGSHATEMW